MMLPHFKHMSTLSINFANAGLAPTLMKDIADVFQAIGGRLRELTFWFPDAAYDTHFLEPLRNLEKLAMYMETDGEGIADVQLDCLPNLPKLNTFKLHHNGEGLYEANYFPVVRPTKKQMSFIANCRQLVSLCVGSFSLRDIDYEEAHDDKLYALQEYVDDRIGLFVHAVMQRSSYPDAPELTYLDLTDTEITSQVWKHVSQLVHLTTLIPYAWDQHNGRIPPFTDADWRLLSAFTNLCELNLICDHLPWNIIFPIILSFKQLHTLKIGCSAVKISTAEFRQLCILPLRKLTLVDVTLEEGASIFLPSTCTMEHKQQVK